MSNPVLEETAHLSINKTLDQEESTTTTTPIPSSPKNSPIPKTNNKQDPYDMTTSIELPEGPAVTELQQMEVRLTKTC